MIWWERGEAFLPKNTVPTVKHGGGDMLWGCFCSNGTGNLVRIKDTMKAENYITILNENIKVSAVDLWLGRRFSFQQDKDPKHKSNVWQHGWKMTKFIFLAGLPGAGSKSNRKFVEKIKYPRWSLAAKNTAPVGRSLGGRMEQYPDWNEVRANRHRGDDLETEVCGGRGDGGGHAHTLFERSGTEYHLSPHFLNDFY